MTFRLKSYMLMCFQCTVTSLLVTLFVVLAVDRAFGDSFTMIDLGTLGGRDSGAGAINTSGQVAGYSFTADGISHAFSWTAAGGMIDLGTLDGRDSGVSAMNDSGQVVGVSFPGDTFPAYHAFLWTAAGGMIDLGTLGGRDSIAGAVNASGQIVGASSTADGTYRAVL